MLRILTEHMHSYVDIVQIHAVLHVPFNGFGFGAVFGFEAVFIVVIVEIVSRGIVFLVDRPVLEH